MVDDGQDGPHTPSFDFESDIVAEGYAYWRSKIHDRTLPGRRTIRPAEIPRLLPHVVLLDVRRTPSWDFGYRLVGTRIVEHLACDHTGMWMSEIEGGQMPATLFDDCRIVAEQAIPLCPRTSYEGPRAEFRRAEDVILPLAEDGRVVDTLLMFVAFLRRV